jgi:cysteine desulfurase / selenocysteine lyase
VYLLDACQTIGQMPIDVQVLGCHFLTATGRKYLRAPRGSGFLYASPAALEDTRLEPAALDVRGGGWTAPDEYILERSARRYEEYEMSFAAKVWSAACTMR